MLFSSRPTASTRLRTALLFATAALSTSCLSVGLLAPAPAAYAATVVSPAAVTTPAAMTATVAATAPTPEQVEEARRAAEASQAAAAKAQAQLSAAQTQLDSLAQQSSVALEAYQQAMEARGAAEAEESAQRERLREAEETLAQGKKDLGQWASQAYRGGGTFEQYSGLVAVLQQGATDDAANRLASMKRLGDGRSNAVLAYAEAQRVQVDSTTKAEAAATAARTQADLATSAKRQADALTAQQASQVAALTLLQDAALGAASSDAERASNLVKAKTAADALAAQATASGLIGVVGDCTGASTSGYANGMIPRSALCPLWGAPNHVLRADAAYAFQQLSQAYAQAFGTPISVTDSYRTLAGQIDVAGRKPGLAATPGTSRHGLGIALDLGAGIQNADSAQHQWMDRNAALYGWINPAWAQNPGGRFEPWHWEFTG